jgi:L-lactate utilization protein LutB
VVVYESTAGEIFIQDDPVSFQSTDASAVKTFVEPVIDKTQRTMTVVFGLLSSANTLIATTGAAVTVKDELGNVLMATTTVSASGVHRAVFPNVNLVPNRVLIIAIVFTIGVNTYNTTDAFKVIGKSTD